MTDYLSYIAFRVLGPVIRSLPLGFSLFLGRRLGDLLYYFDARHKCLAYANIRTALKDKLTQEKITRTTREFYQVFGQNLIEIILIPRIDKEYIKKYITIEGLDNIGAGFKKGKGVIFVSVHAGSWELSNIISSNIGIPFSLFVRDQRDSRLNNLLNSYRSQKGCKLIQRQNYLRGLIDVLKRNEAVGMTIDQGGKSGLLVKFFGKNASMATGAVRLGLKYGATLIPVFFMRLKGPYSKIVINKPFEMKECGDYQKDLGGNLQSLVSIFEKQIAENPREYLWTYRIWKYSDEKNVLILSDGKTGHLRPSEAAANTIRDYLQNKNILARIYTQKVEFKSRLSRNAMAFSCLLAGKYNCQGCLWCMRAFLTKDTYNSLTALKPDIVISCGSSLASVNYVFSRENFAKSIVISRPSILSTKRFDLVVMPRHDNPPKRKNVAVTEGALNLIDEPYIKEHTEMLKQALGTSYKIGGLYIGLLIGGDTKNFCLDEEIVAEVIGQIRSASQALNADILVTTSRRTPRKIEFLVKKQLSDYPRCKLVIIANEKNIPEAVGGILGLSKITITSPESISMISEAASSGSYVIVFESRVDRRHSLFLNHLAKKKYLYLCRPEEIADSIGGLIKERPQINALNDRAALEEALKKVI